MKGKFKYGYFALLLYCTCILSTLASVIWKVQTFPIIIGEDVVIKCIVSEDTCLNNHTKQWTGGPGYKLIGINGYTTNNSKYGMKVHQSSLSFELTVKNFSISDSNNIYTCLCGKAHYTDMLMLNTSGHMYVPLDDDIIDNSYLKYPIIHINVTILKVYPVPTCVLIYNDQTKPLGASENAEDHDSFYKIEYKDLTYVYEQCNITWLLNCTLGNMSFHTDDQQSDTCKLVHDTDDKLIYMNVLFGIPVIFVGIVVYWKHRTYKRRSNVEETESIRLHKIHTPTDHEQKIEDKLTRPI